MASQIELILSDCMPGLHNTPDKFYDLAIVDPPYGIPEAFKGGFASNRKGRKASPFAQNMAKKQWDVKPQKPYFDELFRVSKEQIIWGGNYFIEHLRSSRGICVWVKPEQANGDHPFFSHCELAWTSFHKPAKVITMGTLEGTLERKHPTAKPINLYRKLLNIYAPPQAKILDTHLGSGSIALACYDMGFDLTAYEIDQDYYNEAVKRLENHKRQITFI